MVNTVMQMISYGTTQGSFPTGRSAIRKGGTFGQSARGRSQSALRAETGAIKVGDSFRQKWKIRLTLA